MEQKTARRRLHIYELDLICPIPFYSFTYLLIYYFSDIFFQFVVGKKSTQIIVYQVKIRLNKQAIT